MYEKFIYSIDRAWFSDKTQLLTGTHPDDHFHSPIVWDGLSVPGLPIHVEVYTVRGDTTNWYPNKGFEVRDEKSKSVFEKFMEISPGPFCRADDGRIIVSERPMYHPHNEYYIFFGTDPNDPTDLGGEAHLWLGLGNRAEKHVINKPSLVWIPKGLVHCPLVFRNVRRPFKWVVIVPDYPYVVEHGLNEWPPDYEPYPKAPRGYVDLTKIKIVGPKPTGSETFPK
jgi:hypothetical protein